jgi:propionate catabolism operon transcriptional regulator
MIPLKKKLPKPKMVVIGNTKIEDEIRRCIDISSIPVEVFFEGGDFEEALQIANKYEGEADVFITGESIVEKLRERVSVPVVPIFKDGFDYLNAIIKASSIIGKGKEVIVILYNTPLKEIDILSHVTGLIIRQITYTDIFEIDKVIKKLAEENVELIVGPTLPCLVAERYNIKGISIYSAKTYQNAFTQAINIAVSQRKIKYLFEQHRTISNLTDIGVISCDSSGLITDINNKASMIFGLEHEIAGKTYIQSIINDIEFASLIEENSQVVYKTVSPVLVTNFVDGFVISCQYTEEISNSEYMIRKKQIKKEFKARYSFENFIGNNLLQKKCIAKAKSFSANDFTISIQGETGTGKELLAHAIHDASSRSNGPFITINCAAIPESLLESELFGYESGAFTGGRREGKKGIIELCHNGTLFLDEIGELSHNVQKKLLRFTNEKEIIRVGGNKLIPVNVRIITATNKNLKEELINGNFRLDLFQRISILTLQTIPLRERRNDVPELLRFFFRKHAINRNAMDEKFITFIVSELKDYNWPGNLRELESLAINFIVTTLNTSITYKTIENVIRDFIFVDEKKLSISSNFDKGTVSNILKETHNNKSEAARRLGISRTTMWRLTRKYNSTDQIKLA